MLTRSRRLRPFRPSVSLAAIAVLCVFSATAAAQVQDSGLTERYDYSLLPIPKGAAYPDAYEQYSLELVNRARANPLAEVARFPALGGDLNEGLTPGTISPDAKQPLAFNPNLTDAARTHSQWMVDTDTFEHTGDGGSSPGDRMAAAGYLFLPPWSWGENLAAVFNYPTIRPPKQSIDDMHEGLFVDQTVPSRGHRIIMMTDEFREIGVGWANGPWYMDGYNWQSRALTQDYAYSGPGIYLTGAAYSDAVVDNDFYDPLEGLGGVTVTATNTSTQNQFSTITWTSGGYTLELPPGTYTVSASGGGLGGTVTHSGVTMVTENVKRDFRPDMIQAPQLAITVNVPSGEDWVYQNTEVATADRHRITVTIDLDSEADPAESYTVGLSDDGPGGANFSVGTIVDNGDSLSVEIVGGRIGASTAGAGGASHTATLTVTGQSSGQQAADAAELTLRRLGDATGDGSVGGEDKVALNNRLNGVDPGYSDRALDLDGDNSIGGGDKSIMNAVLNGATVN